MYTRNLSYCLQESLLDTPAVFIRGARQVGKSTLVQEYAKANGAAYATLDSASVLAAAASDPTGFVAGLSRPVVLDEAQRAPKLLLAIKEAIDRDRRPGQFILTGSSNLLASPRVADSLAGRVEPLTLWPLSQGELRGVRENFIDRLFDAASLTVGATDVASRDELLAAMVDGGYPEVLTRANARRRSVWFDAYLTTILERDVRDISQIQDLSALPRLLRLLGARTAALFNQSEISRSSGIANATLTRYLDIFERLFLTFKTPAWQANLGKRLTKAPKHYLVDTGLACQLVGADARRLKAEPELAGRVFENFVVAELMKQATWSETRARLYHYRSTAGSEVDLVLEDASGRVAGVEIKFSATLAGKDFRGLRQLQESLGDTFTAGALLYAGHEVIPFGEKLYALPASVLWG